MKRAFICLLALLLAAQLSACGQEGNTPGSTSAPASQSAVAEDSGIGVPSAYLAPAQEVSADVSSAVTPEIPDEEPFVLVRETTFDPDGSAASQITYEYNNAGSLLNAKHYDRNGMLVFTHQYTYDVSQNLIKSETVYPSGGFTQDADSNVAAPAGGLTYEYHYNEAGQITARYCYSDATESGSTLEKTLKYYIEYEYAPLSEALSNAK